MTELATSGTTTSPLPLSGGKRHRRHASASRRASVRGGRRHKHLKGTKKVSARTIRATLRRLHMRPKGRVVLKGGDVPAADAPAAPAAPAAGGRRHHKRSLKVKNPLKMLGLA
jgi:hypothetical protein